MKYIPKKIFFITNYGSELEVKLPIVRFDVNVNRIVDKKSFLDKEEINFYLN